MLLRLSVSNFLSFKTKQEFSMFARSETVHSNLINKTNSLRVLNYASIYGSNASGKSNLIKAIDFGKKIIIEGLEITQCSEKYHKFGNMRDKETYFDYEIELNGRVYAYGFRAILSKKTVLSEWLYELNKNDNDTVIFTRDLKTKKGTCRLPKTDAKTAKKVNGWLDDSLYTDKELFLKTVISKKRDDIEEISIFSDIFNWFSEKLVIIYPETKIRSFDLIVNNKFNIADAICKLDTGIKSISKKSISKEYLPEQFQNIGFNSMLLDIKEKLIVDEDRKKSIGLSDGTNLFKIYLNEERDDLLFDKMVFCHVEGDDSELLELHEESDGTRRLIDIIMYITNAKENGQTLIIDELERSLHPNLVNELINYYTINEKNSETQLIFTTHDENFIDLSTYRKDTIWFVNKTNKGESILTSLDEFKVRSDRKKVKYDYLEGRFGGVPVINSLVCDTSEESDYEG